MEKQLEESMMITVSEVKRRLKKYWITWHRRLTSIWLPKRSKPEAGEGQAK